jgi:hypothetical protein
MTPKERVEEIYTRYWTAVNNGPVSKNDPLPDFRLLAEQAIIAAVEEDRQITLSAIQSQSEWALKNRDKSVTDSADWHFWFGEVKACELIETQIRARSNPAPS